MKQRVYIETTIVSYLTAQTSRDPARAVHQGITRRWWGSQRTKYDLRVSQFVLDEAGDGDAGAAKKRLEALRDVPILADSVQARTLAKAIVEAGLLPQKAGIDALHLAMAAVHEVDVLLTWNCRHLANANKVRHLQVVNTELGLSVPVITTPDLLLMEVEDDQG